MPSACEMEDGIVVVPGEGEKPVSIINDKFCEELSHPHLFPSRRYRYEIERQIQLTPSKYFNQSFYTWSQINITMKKVLSNNWPAVMLSKNVKQRVQEFIATDKAFIFISSIKGTSAYWKYFLHQGLALVKQLQKHQHFSYHCHVLICDEMS